MKQSKWEDDLISIVVPMPPKLEGIEEYLSSLFKSISDNFVQYEVVLVDRFSQNTESNRLLLMKKIVLQYPGARYISIFGASSIEGAISAGIDTVIGDYCAVTLPFMDPPNVLPKILSDCKEFGCVIIGQRIGVDEGLIVRFSKKVFYFFMRHLADLRLEKNTSYLLAFNRKFLTYLQESKDNFRIIKVLTLQIGMKTKIFSYNQSVDRKSDFYQRSFFSLLGYAIDITTASTERPLRLLSVVLFLVALVSLFKVGLSATFVFALALAIISEYLRRIVIESTKRPPYYLSEDFSQDIKIVGSEIKNVRSK